MANFTAVENETQARLKDAKDLLDYIGSIENDRSKGKLCKVLKGSFFVLLYAALEKTVFFAVSVCIQILNSRNIRLLDIKPVLWAIVFNDECNAIHDAGDKKWAKRWDLFSQITDIDVKQMNDQLYPTTTGNIKILQIEGIWKTFGITQSARKNERIATRLNELAENRMKVAHGREIVSVVGASYTYDDLLKCYNEVQEYLSYIIECFDSYIDNEEYNK